MDDDLLNPIDIDLGDYEDEAGKSESALSNPEMEKEPDKPSRPANPAPSPEDLDKAMSGGMPPPAAPPQAPAIDNAGAPPLPEADKSGVPPLPEVDKTGVPPLPEADKAGVPPLPEAAPQAADNSGVPPLPEVDKSGVPPLPEVDKSGVPPLPEADAVSVDVTPPPTGVPPLPEANEVPEAAPAADGAATIEPTAANPNPTFDQEPDEIQPIDISAPAGSAPSFGGGGVSLGGGEPSAPAVPEAEEQPQNTDAAAASSAAPSGDGGSGAAGNQLKIGEQINLTRTDPGLKKVLIGMGWDAKVFADDSTPDLDVSLFLLDRHDMTRENEDFVFYNNMEACDGGVQHHGDNRTGAGDGDDENITITLSEIPFDIVKIDIVLSIYQGLEKDQSFNDVENIFFRIVNADTQIELFRLELDKIVGGEEAIGAKIGYFLREGPNWFFEATAVPVPRGLEETATEYGIVVAEML